MKETTHSVFLTAEWRKLAMANYVVDPQLLIPYLPAQTEIDFWKGRCYVSLVGFLFSHVRIKQYAVPFHRQFEEVNLRFYVRYKEQDRWKRGVVFIKEFVPLPMVTLIANTLYDERYETLPMKHDWQVTGGNVAVKYAWKKHKRWHDLRVIAANQPEWISEGSEQEFITQHFWGYSKKRDYTSEYQVDHPLWKAYPVSGYDIGVNYEACYGNAFAVLDQLKPLSVYLVEGSPVSIYRDRKIW
jgi:uncharacterized protein YqjF (DUF2071 family)